MVGIGSNGCFVTGTQCLNEGHDYGFARSIVLVFYAGNILVDKNTLYNGCFLNRSIGFIQSLQVIWIVFVSSHVIGHKFLEDVHEDFIQIFKSNQPVPVQPFRGAFEGIPTPLSVQKLQR